ncbi:hypothetical protein Thu_257 [Bacillus phage Thurquoise]|nr:hypothetical protein Thu_13 [Bacillus phage Thurquoise]UXQ89100.1 hypothetical protein Thu_257 [Bacillus phage Thurquoise]
MNNKFNQWTITVMDNNGNHFVCERDTKAEVLEELKDLQLHGQDMDDVNVFPPKSNLTLEEILSL